MCHNFFSSLARSEYLSLFSFSLIFTQWSAGTAKSIIPQVLFIYVNYHLVWFSCQVYVICLYLKIPENLVRLVFQNTFWLVHIPFSSMVEFPFLAQFPVDHFPHSVVVCVIFPCSYLLHSLTCKIISSLSPHNLHLIFRCRLSIFALTLLFLLVLFFLPLEGIHFF